MSITLAICSLLAASTGAQGPDGEAIARIRNEGLNHSQVMPTMSHLCDVIGQRLTGSPSMRRANEWTRDMLTQWGLQNAHLEAWGPFGRGWELQEFSAQVVSPYDIPLIAYPKAWTPPVGDKTADVVLVDTDSAEELKKLAGTLRGKIVMNGGAQPIAARYSPQGVRYTDEQLRTMADATPGAPRQAAGDPAARQRLDTFRARARVAAERLRFFLDEGVLAVIDGARGDDGTVFVQSASVPPPAASPGANPAAPPARGPSVWDLSAPKTAPQVSISAEQYNRMARMIKAGAKLRMRLDLKCRYLTSDPMSYNTVAEIPGSDLKDQIVMAGGHMDSWHAGTGATDNGAGVVAAMEAVRILKACGLQPRRTIRIALWSGEEEGLFGSRAYVAQHLGSFPPSNEPVSFAGNQQRDLSTLVKQPEWDKVSAYYNLDNGTGKIRGIYLQGNAKCGPIFSDWLKPFNDLGATTVTIRNTGSTDHVSFDAVGVPGFQFIQDEIEYSARTHHSNQDVVDRVQEDDLKQAATILAAFLYETAMRDEMMPRKQ